MVTSIFIVLIATFIAGICSVWLAAFLNFGIFAKKTQHLLSFAAGALLATALLHVLPEAFEGQTEFNGLFLTLLLSILVFFFLDKAELWHHGHEHNHDQVHHHCHTHHQHAEKKAGPSGTWAIIIGDSLHCFGDGLMIAASFAANVELGILASFAVLVHEVPHHMGDLAVVGQGSKGKNLALIKVSLAGAATVLGGLIGSLLMLELHDYLPYFMTITASSFIYVALADLVPQLQKHLNFKQTIIQVSWLLAGIVLIYLTTLLHGG
jgi:zinc and cadmium transporter